MKAFVGALVPLLVISACGDGGQQRGSEGGTGAAAPIGGALPAGGATNDAGSGSPVTGGRAGGAAGTSGGAGNSAGSGLAGGSANGGAPGTSGAGNSGGLGTSGGAVNSGGGFGMAGAPPAIPAESAFGEPTVRITPGGWKCPEGITGAPRLDGAAPVRVAGVPPEDGFSMPGTFFAFGNIEGPVWIGDALYVSELSTESYDETNVQVKRARILKVGSDDSVSIAIADSGSNGLAVDGAGAIIAAVHKDGTLTRFNLPDGARSFVATGILDARFDAPNDLVIRSDGNIYFSDPSYQAPAVLPQAATRVYRVTPQGEVVAFEDGFVNPNGVALSLDENTLYVAAQRGRRYPLSADGSVGAGEDFAPMSGVDGVTLDCAGNLYVARGPQVQVYDGAGTSLGSIRVPEVQAVTNLAFGGADRKTLYITGLGPQRGLFKVTLDLPGRPY